MSDLSDHQDAAHVSIGELVQRIDPGVMLTRFVLCAEVIDSGGERGLWMLTQPGATSWDTLGLMEYGKAVEAAALMSGDDDDDDDE